MKRDTEVHLNVEAHKLKFKCSYVENSKSIAIVSIVDHWCFLYPCQSNAAQHEMGQKTVQYQNENYMITQEHTQIYR